MIKEKIKVINNFLAIIDVLIAWISLHLTFYIQKGEFLVFDSKESILLHSLLLFIWFILSKLLRLSELYRTRPYSVLLFNCILLSFIGSAFFIFIVFILKQQYIGIKPFVLFAGINLVLTFSFKFIVFVLFRHARKMGYNTRTVIIMGDKSADVIIKMFLNHKEWGYNIAAVIGDELKNDYNEDLNFLPGYEGIDKALEEETIDELIYCCEIPDMELVQDLIFSCNEIGVVFRMYSPFFNMMSSKTNLHYFGTTPLLTISNTPLDYLSLKLKRLVDFISALFAIVILSPVYVTIALIVLITSKGPVFFKQVRVGLRGRQFWLYKFRTMVENAEELKDKLKEQNEMDGPTFKITNDPRITGVGRYLRKTGLDELPQFFNIILGDMSLVGPRPPVPQEVKGYQRWQLRRLSMKPGLTCTWQISENRNDISFDDWMRMDLEYIDNWSLRLDFIIVLKTFRTLLRADGR